LLSVALVVNFALAPAQAAQQRVAERGESQDAPLVRIDQQEKRFLQALKEFLSALEGSFGDEGSSVWQSVDIMERELVGWDGAIRAFETALLPTPRHAESLIALGKAYLDRGRIEDALREFEAAARQEPRLARAHLHLAMAHRRASRWAEAVEAFQNATAVDGADPTACYSLAQVLWRLTRQEEASRALEGFRKCREANLRGERPVTTAPGRFERITEDPAQLLQQEPGLAPAFVPARYRQGFSLLSQGRYQEAIVAFRSAAARDPLTAQAALPVTRNRRMDPPGDALSLGRHALREGRLDTALGYLSAAVEQDPSDSEARRTLATAYWADGQHERSVEQYRAALRLQPHDERVRMALVGVLASSRRFAEAEQALKESIEAIPDSGQAHYNLGRLYDTLGRREEALKKFEDAVGFEPVAGLDELHRRIARMYYQQVNLDVAIEALHKALEVNPNSLQAHMDLGSIHLQRNRYGEALAEFLAVLLIDPRNQEAYASIAQVHLRTGRYAEAAEAGHRALDLDRYHARAQYALGMALIRLGKTEDGRKELEKFQQGQAEAEVREHRDREFTALRQEAAARLEKGEYDTAIALLRKAVEYEPRLGIPHLNLGVALAKAGRYEEALQALQKAVELKIDSPQLHQHLAEAYEALGKWEESVREKAILSRKKGEQLRRRAGNP